MLQYGASCAYLNLPFDLVPTDICPLIKLFKCVLVTPFRVTEVLARLAGEVLPKSVPAARHVQQSAQILDTCPSTTMMGPCLWDTLRQSPGLWVSV